MAADLTNMETGCDLGRALMSVRVPKRHRKKKYTYTHSHTHLYIWQIKQMLSFPLPFWKLSIFTIKGNPDAQRLQDLYREIDT